MLVAPLIGVVIGSLTAGVLVIVRFAIVVDSAVNVLLAVLGIAVLTALSRGLHLDGLADTADALGSYRGPERAAEIMSRGDVGPFGVTAIVFTLLLQVGGLHGSLQAHRATEALIVGAMAGALAATICCVGVPAARPDGLGAMVARTLRWWHAAAACVLCVLLAAVAGSIDEGAGVDGSTRAVVALVVGVAAGLGFMRHAVRRFGGISGDVFGAVIEIALTTTLLAVAVIS